MHDVESRRREAAVSPRGTGGRQPRQSAENGPRVRWWLYALAWLPAAAFYAGALVVQGQATLSQSIASGLVVMTTAALEGAAVWMITARLRMPPWRPLPFFAAHVGLAVVYGAVGVAILVGWLWLVAGGDVAREVWRQAGIWQGVTGMWIYAMVAGIWYLLRTRHRLRQQQIAAARAAAESARVQLQAVRSQINPHFFYNALHSLSTLVRHDPARAELALDRLGQLMRYALDGPAERMVCLTDEWAFVTAYVEMERLRLGDRLRLEARLEDDALECQVPPFVLQPLVENAIRHSIAPRAAGGRVEVNVMIEEGRLHLDVWDDGPATAHASPENGHGHGLSTLRRLIAARYGGAARLEAGPDPRGGFRAVVTLPAGGDRSSAKPA